MEIPKPNVRLRNVSAKNDLNEKDVFTQLLGEQRHIAEQKIGQKTPIEQRLDTNPQKKNRARRKKRKGHNNPI